MQGYLVENTGDFPTQAFKHFVDALRFMRQYVMLDGIQITRKTALSHAFETQNGDYFTVSRCRIYDMDDSTESIQCA